MSVYLQILAVQAPFDIGPDENDRIQYSCNYECTTRGTVTAFENEIAKIISDAGLGTLNTDMFLTRRSTVPIDDGPYVTIISTSGMPPMETHNNNRYERLTCNVIVRGLNFPLTRTRAFAIWRALDGKRGLAVTAP